MKGKISVIFLLIFIIASTGCIQVSNQTKSCDSGFIGMNYVEKTYLWGNEGFFTKKYDASISLFGIPKVKTDISQFELQTYLNAYCQKVPSTQMTLYPTLNFATMTASTKILTPVVTPSSTIEKIPSPTQNSLGIEGLHR